MRVDHACVHMHVSAEHARMQDDDDDDLHAHCQGYCQGRIPVTQHSTAQQHSTAGVIGMRGAPGRERRRSPSRCHDEAPPRSSTLG